MPSKNEVKSYIPEGIYHLYNRGVEKRKIFLDEEDYSVFLSYLKNYLLNKDEDGLREKLVSLTTSSKEKDKIIKLLRLNNFSDDLTLLVYGLMPNHFHLLVQQKTAYVINKFMNSLITRYSMYFNKKYRRVGPLFQGVYKAVLVGSEEQLLHLSRYIHHQTLKTFPSSYNNYLGRIMQDWLKTDMILSYFNKSNDNINLYKAFVESLDDEETQIIKDLKLED